MATDAQIKKRKKPVQKDRKKKVREPNPRGPVLTEADAEADLRGEPRPDNPTV